MAKKKLKASEKVAKILNKALRLHDKMDDFLDELESLHYALQLEEEGAKNES